MSDISQHRVEQLATQTCPQCSVNIEYPLDLAGQEVACPQCAATLILPVRAESLHDEALTLPVLLQAFSCGVTRKRPTILYQFGIVLVSILMILLPVVYFTVAALVGWGTSYFATHYTWIIQSMRGGVHVYFLRLAAYIGPIFAGLVLLFFLIKPLVSRAREKSRSIVLGPSEEPLLQAYVQLICDLVGASRPSEIVIDCDLNASASFRRGFFSLFKNDLSLTIGLPLVASLNTTQLAGVIAHEFGHFNQGIGMRASYLIRQVNRWFVRVIYERDGWDAMLESMANDDEEDYRMKLVVWCAQGSVSLARLLLKPLMFLGHGVSCFMLRQMEYDADSYEIKLAGSRAFESTVFQIRVMAGAMNAAYRDLHAGWLAKQRLPVDMAQFVLLKASEMPADIRQKIIDETGFKTTATFDTHPSDADRIREARRAGADGVLNLEQPATCLFTNFSELSQRITAMHYAEDLGIPLKQSMLFPVEAFRESVPVSGQ